MGAQPGSEYCPKCEQIQPTFEFMDGARAAHRCQVCGFPLGGGLELESALEKPTNAVLIVDDDPLIVRMYRDLLEHNDFVVLSAPDGATALEVAAQEQPALILLDIMMAGMDGFEVCRRLKADPALKSIPVIVLTAMTDPKLNVQAFKVGAELVLKKPAEPATVLRTIQTALALAASRKGQA